MYKDSINKCSNGNKETHEIEIKIYKMIGISYWYVHLPTGCESKSCDLSIGAFIRVIANFFIRVHNSTAKHSNI